MARLPQYGYFLLLAALLCFLANFLFQRKERARKDWPTASGQMINSSIIQRDKAYLETPTTGRTVRDDKYYRSAKVWDLAVAYRYTVAGEERVGTQATATREVDLLSDYPNAPSKRMVDWNQQLSAGTPVTVHYDPNDLSASYVIYTESPSAAVGVRVGWGLLVLGLALIAVPRLMR